MASDARPSLLVWMVCDNCGTADSGPDGVMYECPACGSGDGWGCESEAEAQRRSAEIVKRRRIDGSIRVRDLWHQPACAIFNGSPACSCGAVADAVKRNPGGAA